MDRGFVEVPGLPHNATEDRLGAEMRRLWHWIKHCLRLSGGRAETWWETSGGSDRLMTGVRCECGELVRVTEAWRRGGNHD